MDLFKLFMSIRILVAIFILFYLKIPLTYKLLLIIFFDNLDGRIPKMLNIYKYNHTKTKKYQTHDKVADLVGYLLILYYIYKNNILTKQQFNVIILFLGYRIIGDIIYFIQKNRKIFFYFPNIYEKLILFWVILKDFNINLDYAYQSVFIILIVLLKVYQEYTLHYCSDKNPKIKKLSEDVIKGKADFKTLFKFMKKSYVY